MVTSSSSMESIVSVHLGQCGCQMGQQFWERLCQDHGVTHQGSYNGDSDLQLDKIQVYFNERQQEHHRYQYVPRAVFVDKDLTGLTNCSYGQLFNDTSLVTAAAAATGTGTASSVSSSLPSSSFSSQATASPNFPSLSDTFGTNGILLAATMEAVRHQVESCDVLQGIQMMHALSGSVGCGVGRHVLTRLREDYPRSPLFTFSIVPDTTVTENNNPDPWTPVHTVMGLATLKQTASLVFPMDNRACRNIAWMDDPTRMQKADCLNSSPIHAMADLTAAFRFGSPSMTVDKVTVDQVTTMRGLQHYLVPGAAALRHMHFVTMGASAMTPAYASSPFSLLVRALTDRQRWLVAGDNLPLHSASHTIPSTDANATINAASTAIAQTIPSTLITTNSNHQDAAPAAIAVAVFLRGRLPNLTTDIQTHSATAAHAFGVPSAQPQHLALHLTSPFATRRRTSCHASFAANSSGVASLFHRVLRDAAHADPACCGVSRDEWETAVQDVTQLWHSYMALSEPVGR